MTDTPSFSEVARNCLFSGTRISATLPVRSQKPSSSSTDHTKPKPNAKRLPDPDSFPEDERPNKLSRSGSPCQMEPEDEARPCADDATCVAQAIRILTETVGENALDLDMAPQDPHGTPKASHTPLLPSRDSTADVVISEPPSSYLLTASRAATGPIIAQDSLPDNYDNMEVRPSQSAYAVGNSLAADLVVGGGDAQKILNNYPTTEQVLDIWADLLERTTKSFEKLISASKNHPHNYRVVAETRLAYRNMLGEHVGAIDRDIDAENSAGLPAGAPLKASVPLTRDQPVSISSLHQGMLAMQETLTLLCSKMGVQPGITPSWNGPWAQKPSDVDDSWLDQPPLGDGFPQGPCLSWADQMQFEDDHADPTRTLASTEANPAAAAPGASRNDDGFTTVENRGNKGKGKVTYAQVTKPTAAPEKRKTAPKPPQVSGEKIATALRNAGKQQHTRFSVTLRGNASEITKRLPPRSMRERTNAALIKINSPIRLVTAEWNRKNNLVLSFPYGTATKDVERAIPAIQKAIDLPEDSIFTRCTSWSKVVLSSVPTGVDMGHGVRFSSEELLEELRASNPITGPLEITQPPRWITKNTNLEKVKSSFTFAFEDNADGEGLKELLRHRFSMFGETIKIAKWTEKPLLKGCDKCKGLDHFTHPFWKPIGYSPSTDPSEPRPHHTVSNPAWSCFVPVSPNSSPGPGVAVYYRKGRGWLDANISTSYAPSTSLMAMDFSIYGFRLRLVNIYLHGPSAKEGLSQLIDTPADPTIPTIFVGDFNLHHELWSPEDYTITHASSEAQDLAEWILANDLEIMNRQNVITRRGHRGQRDSVIDLTIVNRKAWNQDLVMEWECERGLSYGSDHNGISFDVVIPPNTRYHPPPTAYRYSIDASRRDDWLTAFHRIIGNSPPPETYSTPEDCQNGALAILNAMTEATRIVMPRTRADGAPPRAAWWSTDCSLAVRELKANEDKDLVEPIRGRIRTCIRRARTEAANRICSEVTLQDLHKLTEWYSGKRKTKMPPIWNGSAFATDPEDIAKIFRDSFFPQAPPRVDSESLMGITPRETRDHHPISDSEIKAALDTSSNTSAPGAFGSNYRILKWAYESKPGLIADLYNACLDQGYHPACLRNAIVAIVPKPRRPDMSRPNAYRPISLLETLSKCLEKIITSRILFEVGKHNLVPFSQFGGRDASSCTDAGLAMVHDIQSFWKNAEKTSLLTLDIKGYFNNINHARLLRNMSTLGFSEPLCNWLRSYLSDRTVQIRIDSHLCAPVSIAPVGVPQGSPLSPILSTIYTLPLLLDLNNRHNFLIKGYVDDFTILAHSATFDSNNAILKNAVDEAAGWLSRLGLSFELEKCELIHFAAHKRDLALNPDIHLRTSDATSGVVRAAHTIRWLGFFLDRRLDFKSHVSKMATKGLGVISGLRLLANTLRGLSTKHARILYKTCVMPVFTYGSPLWHTG
ncbi:hypothetical protein FRC06_001931, partial [Ceratobasidium sp. 370]